MLPKITHLQFLVLNIVRSHRLHADGLISGRELRKAMKDQGVVKRGPSFYQLMRRLESGGLVRGQNKDHVIDDHKITVRKYRITSFGRQAIDDTWKFYRSRMTDVVHSLEYAQYRLKNRDHGS